MHKYLKLCLWILAYLVIAFVIGQISQGSIDGWYETLEKPSFNPPNWIFAPVWTFLYVLIATAGWKLWCSDAPKTLKNTYVLYTILNWLWTPIFFGAEQILFALIWIIAINGVTVFLIWRSWRPVPLTAWLMVLPLCWTFFAMLLNASIWMLNT